MADLILHPPRDDGADAAYEVPADERTDLVGLPAASSGGGVVECGPDAPVDPSLICPNPRRAGLPHYLVVTTDGAVFCPFCRWWSTLEDLTHAPILNHPRDVPSPIPVAVACGYSLLLTTTFEATTALCARLGAVPVAVDPAGRCTYILDSLSVWLGLGGRYFELRAVPAVTVRAYQKNCKRRNKND